MIQSSFTHGNSQTLASWETGKVPLTKEETLGIDALGLTVISYLLLYCNV